MSDKLIRNPLVYHGCFACDRRETCYDAFWSNAIHCNAYGKLEIQKVDSHSDTRGKNDG